MSVILNAGDLSFPVDAEQTFGRSGRLVFEIGFGNGDFLLHLSRQHPDWNVIGAETSPASVKRAYRRIKTHGVANVRLFTGDGRFLVRNVAPNGGLTRVFVNFPDPWPRRRHARRRLLSADFFRMLATRLEPEGSLSLATDHAEYFEFARSQAKQTGLFREEIAPPDLAMLETRWARRWLEQRKNIFHVHFGLEKTVDAKYPRLETPDMQHALLRGKLDGLRSFEKEVFKVGDATVVLTAAYRSLDGQSVVFEAIVEEHDLRQSVLIEARPKGEDVLVGVRRFGRPLSTRGLNAAVGCVADYLAGQGLEVLDRSY